MGQVITDETFGYKAASENTKTKSHMQKAFALSVTGFQA